MTPYNPQNERIKREYFRWLKEARRYSEATVDAAAEALARFEADAKFRDFRLFHFEQAIAFKRRLAEQDSPTTGKPLSKATLHATCAHVKRFFEWLSSQTRHKPRFRYTDAQYFNTSGKDARVATARREKPFPTLEQVKRVIETMPDGSDIERRDRALVAFTLLTGARDGAIASMKLKHIDVIAGSVCQDAREVKTKNSKTFTTFFFPVGDEVRAIVVQWVTYLREVKLWGNDDPVFPSTEIAVGDANQFEVVGLTREPWASAEPIRTIFRRAFTSAGLPYFNPHSFRNTLAQLGQRRCRTAEEFKAWSQNLGHEGVLTTLCSYGVVGTDRQGEIIQSLCTSQPVEAANAEAIAEAVFRRFERSGGAR